MSTIKEKLYFNFDGISSTEFGLIHVSLDNGMHEETLVSTREVREQKTRGNDKSNFFGIETTPLEFDLNIAFEREFTDKEIYDVIRWLFVDSYKPLFFYGAESRVFYCLPVGDSAIIHNGLKQGYITLKMRCNSSNRYSPIKMSQKYDLTDGIKQTIELYNDGHSILRPEISILKIGIGNVTITNLTDDGSIFEIRDLTNQEDIYINTEKEIIKSDILGVHRYDKVIGKYTRLLYGRNTIEIEGSCIIQFRYQSTYKF